MKSITILANDPGSSNYGYAVVKATVRGRGLKIEILKHGLFTPTVKDMTGGMVQKQTEAYLLAMKNVIKEYQPNFWIAERFSTRGIKGKTIELVCLMLGATMGRFPNMRYRLYIAAQWKNEVNKKGDLKNFYRYMKRHKITAHQIDACFIGIYAAHKLAGLKALDFIPKNMEKHLCNAQ